jgi:predicted O-methyltransferase YrrM
MSQELWTAIDSYIVDHLIETDEVLEAAQKAADEAGLPQIAVAPNQGKLLLLLVRLSGARRILELGTLAGYSAIWMARALPSDGKLVTLESEPRHAAVARANFRRAGLNGVVELREGDALESLAAMKREGIPPFDLIFIDADKKRIPEYFEGVLSLSRSGTVVIVDNVIRDGTVIDGSSSDPSVLGVRRFNELLANDRRVTATTLQTVGSKGHDGFTIAVVDALGAAVERELSLPGAPKALG